MTFYHDNFLQFIFSVIISCSKMFFRQRFYKALVFSNESFFCSSILKNQPSEAFYKKGVIKNFAKFSRKHLSWTLLLNKITKCLRSATFLKKQTPTQVFFCEVCETFKNIFFTEHLRATASDSISFSQYTNSFL